MSVDDNNICRQKNQSQGSLWKEGSVMATELSMKSEDLSYKGEIFYLEGILIKIAQSLYLVRQFL